MIQLTKQQGEDLLYAVKSRIQVLHRIEGLAWDAMNGKLATQCICERERQESLEQMLAQHVGEHHGRADILCALLPDFCV